jgi:hypothetical protein
MALPDRYYIYRIDPEMGIAKDLPFVTVFTAAEVLEVMSNMFVGKKFETENGPLETQVIVPWFAEDDELVIMSDDNDPTVLDYFIVKKKG